ncbi:ABC transporter permease [Vibrio sagamiensis]|uniref:Peptide ABC transporter permease n=1 Tax=Vibrio sagamiensis NBRC 104589 TaxID=1219064 RepID=A0A511QC13_9VIBR|nr:ABC transporter permease subunit [Vibrio sagamiensis]PNQ54341.1 dipeptide ABC transporter permease DppB [Vibrio agarivorans]GEM74835.1 peptide ABC transporter permease [Vibrio sagamiensis NBRC 104589]
MNASNRFFSFLMTLLGISFLAFFLIRLAPGDPVMLLIGERGADIKQYQAIVSELGFEQPILSQFLIFIKNAITGDFGSSVVSRQPVLDELLSRWPATIELGVSAILIALILGIPAGVIAALNRNKIVDFVVMASSLVGYSMPIFWWGLILILVFSIGLDLTPVSGRIDILYDIEPVTGFMLLDTLIPNNRMNYGFEAFFSAVSHLILPAFAMATIPIAVFARMTRSSMLEILGEDYIRTARAKGLSHYRVIWIHALRNALIPIVTVGGILFISSVITGAILTETIFGWPGIGSYLVSSIYARDYPVIQGSILIIGLFILITNIFIERLYLIANPKMSSKLS